MYTQERTYIVIGLQRSGNHAVINWLLSNQQFEKLALLNNCTPHTNPYQSCINNLLTDFSSQLDLDKEVLQPSKKDVLVQYKVLCSDVGHFFVNYLDKHSRIFLNKRVELKLTCLIFVEKRN